MSVLSTCGAFERLVSEWGGGDRSVLSGTHVQHDVAEQAMLAHRAQRLQKRRLHRVVGVLEEAQVLHGIVCRTNREGWKRIDGVIGTLC